MNSPSADGRGPNAGRSVQLTQVAQWRLARNLFPVYAELASRSAGVCPPPFSSFGADDRPESLDAVKNWFDAVDNTLSPADFRASMAAIIASNGESALYTVAQHLLASRRSDAASRSKLEFVLVQYFLVCSPPSFHTRSATCADISAVLQPVWPRLPAAGATSVASADDGGDSTSDSLLILSGLAARLQNCSTLSELYEIAGTLETCKQQMGDAYYEPAALAHITHAQFLLKLGARDVARTSVTDVTSKIEQLRQRGVTTLDCRAAGLTDREVLTVLVAKWKGLNDSDIEYRLDEIAPVLLAVEKTLGDQTSSAACTTTDVGRVGQLESDLASLRSLADRLSTQLAAITQRVQRLEASMPASELRRLSEVPRTRPTTPATPGPLAPIAVRATTSAAATASTAAKPAGPPNATTPNGNPDRR